MNFRFRKADVRTPAKQVRRNARRRSGRRGRDNFRRRQFREQGRRIHAQQDTQAVNRLPGRGLQQRDLGRRGCHLGVGVGDVQTAGESALKPLAGQGGAMLLGGQILPRNG